MIRTLNIIWLMIKHSLSWRVAEITWDLFLNPMNVMHKNVINKYKDYTNSNEYKKKVDEIYGR